MKQGILHNLNNLLCGMEITISRGLATGNHLASLERLQLLSHQAQKLLKEVYHSGPNHLETLEEVDLVSELEDALEQASLIFPDATIKIHRQYKATPIIHGRRVHFQQVFLNLIINAFEAMTATTTREEALSVSSATPNGGEGNANSNSLPEEEMSLAFLVEEENEKICLIIRDSGPGISPENAQRVFLPYFSTKAPSEYAAGSGQGIGLWVSRRIAEGYGGELVLSSQLGEGTAFILTLPLHGTTLPLESEELVPQGPSLAIKIQQGRILVVDDDEVIRETLGELLSREGYEVEMASGFREMKEKLDQSQFDLLLTDVFMPTCPSWDTFLEGDFKVVAMSGEDPLNLQGNPLVSRADVFIQKPFTLGDILSGIEGLFTPLKRERFSAMEEDKQGRDHRRHPRVSSINLISVMQVAPNVLEEYGQLGSTVNLSQGGVLFESKYPFPLQSTVKLTLELNQKLTEVTGRVIRLEEVEENRISVAVRFVDMSEENKELLKVYLDKKDG